MSVSAVSSAGYSGAVLADAADILPELNGADLAMSLSPKPLQHTHAHTTPFSVTDILSPIEESYRKLELCAPSSPYRSSGGSSGSGGSTGPAASSPTMSGYMHVHQFPSQYCNGSDPLAYNGSTTAGWYGASANDPRFASECNTVRDNMSVSITCFKVMFASEAFQSDVTRGGGVERGTPPSLLLTTPKIH